MPKKEGLARRTPRAVRFSEATETLFRRTAHERGIGLSSFLRIILTDFLRHQKKYAAIMSGLQSGSHLGQPILCHLSKEENARLEAAVAEIDQGSNVSNVIRLVCDAYFIINAPEP